jgi:sugar phosphate isomerase/epimerase
VVTIGLNLFSLRDLCQTFDDFSSTLKKVAEIGYSSVQVSGIPVYDPALIRQMLDANNLTACACHESLELLRQDRKSIIDKLTTLGASFTALGAPPPELRSPEQFPQLIVELNGYAKEFATHGIQFGYHNHAFEFQMLNDKSIYELIFVEGPDLYAEPDTHWIQRGGGDPASWIRKLKGRVPAVHLKDYIWRDDGPQFAEVGHGNLNWERIFESCAYSGVDYYIVEQDQPTPGVPILESVAKSFEYLSSWLS